MRANRCPANTPPRDLKQGDFIWFGDATRSGPLLLVVSINEQLAYVYRNGVLTGVSTVSTGKKGHETPTGVFTVLQKNKDHYSNLYNNAPMPYMQRLTWGGIALHAGACRATRPRMAAFVCRANSRDCCSKSPPRA